MFKNLLKKTGSGKSSGSPAAPSVPGSRQSADIKNRPSRSFSLASNTPVQEVFQSHWRQALGVIKGSSVGSGRSCTSEDVNAVIQIVEKMCDLLVSERGENFQQGECLSYLLSENILEQLVTWCLDAKVYEHRIKYELLKILDNMINQSEQALLYHKPIIRPLLTLLASCDDSNLVDIERQMIVLLHTLCICVSKDPQYLELFFNVSSTTPHQKQPQSEQSFLIFCLLIPYIHREGQLGQSARDALLLIMAASARNQVIGRYIANNSDFCPVLATGLSALYSGLPHKIRPEGHEDWYRIDKENYLDMPEVQMIINCLEFCNAVVQVAHTLVGQQLIDYMYNGFLIPVMAPALLQNSIEEQVSAIAYLELFVRTVTEPALLRAFLHFILTTKHDDVVMLEWLIDRISSSTKLCMVSLSLFKTLIELNCEDVMFSLIFKYLYKQSHVMQSQRRAIRELDIYGKIADRLLQLEPECCQTELTDEQHKLLVTYNDGFYARTEFDFLSNLPFNFRLGAMAESARISLPSIFSSPSTSTQQGDILDYKSSYLEYLSEARHLIEECSLACVDWCYPYDGEFPPYNAAIEDLTTNLTSHRYDTPEVSLEDDISLLSLGTDSPLNTATSSPIKLSPKMKRFDRNLSQDSQLIDISSEPNDKSDLLIDIDTSDTTPQAASQDAPSDVPLLDLGDQMYTETTTTKTDSVDTVLITRTGDQEQTTSIPHYAFCKETTEDKQVSSSSDQYASFLQFLDEKADKLAAAVAVSCDSSADDLLSDMDQFIKQAEQRISERKKRGTSLVGGASPGVSDVLQRYQTDSTVSEALQSIQLHSADIGQNSSAEHHRSRRSSSALNLRLVETIDTTPTIGPFLLTLLQKLENMMANSLAVNLLLTSVIMRLACYPHPLLRSYLLNHSLVFQPTVKSLIQVLTSVKHKLDSFAVSVPNFSVLILQARKIMLDRANSLETDTEPKTQVNRSASITSESSLNFDVFKSPTKKKITDLFKREHKQQKPLNTQPELVKEREGYRFSNNKSELQAAESPQARLAAINTKKAVYCALVLEEFVKELAALSQEHSVHSDEGYQTD